MWLSTLPVFKLGFRPFYLLAALFAALALPLWMGIYLGYIAPGGYPGVAWHSHEMVFGFAIAVIAGFLLTAVRNWTGLETPAGSRLTALAALWLLGRVLMLLGPPTAAAIIDFLFLPALGLAVGIPIVRSKNRRNYKVLIVVSGLAVANLSFHLAQLGIFSVDFGRLSIVVALDMIVILMAIIGGRVIPAFIGNALPVARPRQLFGVEVVAISSLFLILAADISSVRLLLPGDFRSGLMVVASIANFIRLLLWNPFQARHDVLLGMLPVAYAWIPVALLLRAVAQLPGGVSASSAFHALTIGAIASLMVAMMIRSALGHTGRALKAGRFEIATFLMLQLSVITRIFPGIFRTVHHQVFLYSSATLWSLAFGLFVCRYWPVLTRERVDETE